MTPSFSPPIHPGEVLREEFLVPLGLSRHAVARRLGVPRTRIEGLAAERIAVTADTALRLSRLLGTTPDFWLSMQASFDLATVATAMKDELDRIERLPSS